MLLEHHKEEYQHWSDSGEDSDDDDEDDDEEASSSSRDVEGDFDFTSTSDDPDLVELRQLRKLKEMATEIHEQETEFGPEDKVLLL